MNVWVGNFGNYPIPDDVRNLVKRWRKDGWPHKQDKGRDAFLGWVTLQELEAQHDQIFARIHAAGSFEVRKVRDSFKRAFDNRH